MHLFLLFNYAKAFDGVDHNKLWKILQEMGILHHLTCLLRNLYAGQEATVRTGHGITDWFQIGKGVHQGCILSPCLFNFYAEYIMRNTGLEEAQSGIKIAGRNINNLRRSSQQSEKFKYQARLTLWHPKDLMEPTRLLCADSPGKNTGAAIPFSRRSSWPGDHTQVSCIAGRFFTIWATREALVKYFPKLADLKKHLLSQFWGQEVWNQVHRQSPLPLKVLGISVFLSFPVLCWLLAIWHSLVCRRIIPTLSSHGAFPVCLHVVFSL